MPATGTGVAVATVSGGVAGCIGGKGADGTTLNGRISARGTSWHYWKKSPGTWSAVTPTTTGANA